MGRGGRLWFCQFAVTTSLGRVKQWQFFNGDSAMNRLSKLRCRVNTTQASASSSE